MLVHSKSDLTYAFFLCFIVRYAVAFNMSSKQNLAMYWGQNSYGTVNPSNTSQWQQSISYYCNDDMIDIFVMAFLDVFYSTCNDVTVFPGTNLPNSTFLASDIEACQAAGKIVTISLGGATGSYGFTDDAEGAAYAQTIWDLFLGGSSSTRPFGSAVLDGIDMDIEGGSQIGFVSFLTALRNLMNGGNKKYYLTAAPQCPYPDAYIGDTLNTVEFDAVYVQFYNNYCGLTDYSDLNDWNFGIWDNWAKTASPNPNVKVYIGAPASSSSARSGYVSPSTITSIIQETKAEYSSFGGVMLWDASQAYANSRYDVCVKNALSGGTAPTTTTPISSTPSIASPTMSSSTGSCSGVGPWQPSVTYAGGDEVTYNGNIWTAKWWSVSDVPGGVAGDWMEDGAC
ncbi:hypothetical protein AZE42_01539 [Rhizopogon vesiculosus]|uniref:chitinase n=1 Tax=Rhizopogon vesiculosus TaxID=180088 RepID=A0A1J8QW78_9AGAM|nr:hypothetical protein AZE42_01539 [Rhizopogon vesiculosus]